MVTTETHQSQDLLVPQQNQNQQDQDLQDQLEDQVFTVSALDPEAMTQGPVNAITVLTLLDKLVHMLDAVQENQGKMEVHQVQMEGVVRGIQADMTKLSKSHSHTSNTVSKLLDKSRRLSVTMKEVRDKMERQGVQVKKLEANHAHLISRNNFKVLIFQEETEIPSTVFVKDPPPFPREEILEEGEESVQGVADGNRSEEGGLHSIDLSSDEDVGLEAELEEEEAWLQDLENNPEKSRTEKLKRSSLKKVDSLKKAFSRQNIEKKMTKIGTKIVSMEQRDKIKQKTSSLKVSPMSFSFGKHRSGSDSHPAEASLQEEEAVIPEETDVQLTSPGSTDQEVAFTEQEVAFTKQEVSFTEVHAQLAPAEQVEKEEEKEGKEKGGEEEEKGDEEEKGEEEEKEEEEGDVSVGSEGVGPDYALSSTLPQDENQS
ncbi:caveolae-associated protein 2b [Sander lucioperca]|uniref:caveolae-associated protein 2b n=1 Tax=Sander lucioperca TaxID=283035 RepID=UPI00125DA85F|nr:caveolae-associated protein 2b [Sander lucioperca]